MLELKTIQGFAEAVAKENDYKPGGDLQDLVKKIGGSIIFKDTLCPEHRDYSLLIRGAGDFYIILPRHTDPVKDRFIIAHELGHYFIHYLYKQRAQGRMKVPRVGVGREEKEANVFAASFLMPMEEFRSSFKLHKGNLAPIASQFGLSMRDAKTWSENFLNS